MALKVMLGQKGLNWQKKNALVRAITIEGHKLGSPNLCIRCIIGRSWTVLDMLEFDHDL